MIILGIDPGYAIVGWGVIKAEGNKFTLLDYGAVTTPAHTPMPYRLNLIFEGISEIISRYKIDAVAIEELFFNTNSKTVIEVGEGRGVILLAVQRAGIPIFEYTPLQVKQGVCNYGRAEKQQVMEMVRRLLGLKAVPKPDDAADGLALAICHYNMKRSNAAAQLIKNITR